MQAWRVAQQPASARAGAGVAEDRDGQREVSFGEARAARPACGCWAGISKLGVREKGAARAACRGGASGRSGEW